MFHLAQTFYVDPNSVNNASKIFLVGVDLYFSSKPTATNNASGVVNPGVQISLCKTSQKIPDLTNIIPLSYVRKEYSEVTALGDASAATSFTFDQPIPVDTGYSYAILFAKDDMGYGLWKATQGEKIIGTSTAFSGVSSGMQGNYYEYSNDGTWLPRSSTQIKFKVKVAKFTSNTNTIEIVNKPYEFINYNSSSGSFMGGETVFVDSSNSNGTISVVLSNNIVTGTGTNFTTLFSTNDNIVVVDGASKFVRKILSVVSDTQLILSEGSPTTNATANYFKSVTATVYQNNPLSNTIYLADSNANSTVRFTSNTTIRGAISNATANVVSLFDYPVSQFTPSLLISLPSEGSANLEYNFSYSSGNTFVVNSYFMDTFLNNNLETVNGYKALIMSRSNEVVNANNLYNANTSSVILVDLNINKSSNTLFESPYLFEDKLDIFTGANKVNNDYTNENTRYGNAESKHITTKVFFDRSAEDLLVYATMYKPAGTDVKVFAKIYNNNDSDAFDDKDWTLLSTKNNSNNQTSSSTNLQDFVELEYGFSQYPDSLATLAGTITTVNGSSNVVGSNTTFTTSLASNQLIKLYSPLFPQNYMIGVVDTISNNTLLTLKTPVSNVNVVGSGFKVDTLKFENAAFNNIMNDNVVRYYNSSKIEFDSYDTFQLKIVLLAADENVVPRISSLRGVGVSA